MRLRSILIVTLALGVLVASGCKQNQGGPAGGATAGNTAATKPASPELPDNGFKAQITLPNPPRKLRAGQKETLQVRVKNASDVQWPANGGPNNRREDNKYYIAAANRWLRADEQLLTDMDGRYGLPRDLNPGEEVEVPLLVTAPKEPGDYVLELDVVQEQVAWFRDKGSETAKFKVKVER